MEFLLYSFVALFGLTVGSFLNVCIYRLPEGKSIVRPRSHCPACGEAIRAYDNIPVLSYILLKGRCRSCRHRISVQYPVVEIASAILLVLVYREFGLSVESLGYGFFSLALLTVFFTDLNKRIIPDRVTYPSVVIGLVFRAISGGFVDGLLGSAAGFVLLLLIAWFGRLVFRKEAMGGGDLKLAAVVGAFIGWKLLLVGLFVAFILGAISGAIYILFRGRKEGSEIAFGPFIAAGALTSLFWGQQLLDLYLNLVWR